MQLQRRRCPATPGRPRTPTPGSTQEQGFITPYAGDSTGFVEKWKRHLTWANPQDLLGLRLRRRHQRPRRPGRPATRRRDQPGDLPVHRPRRRQGRQAGQRPAHLRHQQGRRRALRALPGLDPGPEDAGRATDIVKDMSRGPEAYLQMWERAYGVAPNACTNPASQARRRRPSPRRAGRA